MMTPARAGGFGEERGGVLAGEVERRFEELVYDTEAGFELGGDDRRWDVPFQFVGICDNNFFFGEYREERERKGERKERRGRGCRGRRRRGWRVRVRVRVGGGVRG